MVENQKDKTGGPVSAKDVEGGAIEGPVSTRRRFGARAALGAAVLLTVGNRAAWGRFGEFSGGEKGGKGGNGKPGQKYEKACISQRTWDSYAKGNPSHGPGGKKGKFSKEIEAFQDFCSEGSYTLYRKDEGLLGNKEYCAVREVSQQEQTPWYRRR